MPTKEHDGAEAAATARDVQLLEGVWTCRFHPLKLSQIAECEEAELAPWLCRLLGPHGVGGEPVTNHVVGPKLVVTAAEEYAKPRVLDGSKDAKPRKKTSAKAAAAEKQATTFFKDLKCAQLLDQWDQAMLEARTLLDASAEPLPMRMRYDLLPLQHGERWTLADPKAAKYAKSIQEMREEAEEDGNKENGRPLCRQPTRADGALFKPPLQVT